MTHLEDVKIMCEGNDELAAWVVKTEIRIRMLELGITEQDVHESRFPEYPDAY